eukprot:NODE_289_length_10645_cov_0.615115.p6 type:complete len:216 gc:universal NODE_289_length_10645_cov_0.615115:1043-396(-)
MKILVIGGNGQLGKVIVSHLKTQAHVISLDFGPNPDANESVIIKDVLTDNFDNLPSVDSIISAAGGWAGGSISSKELLESVSKMFHMNTLSAALAGHLASLKLKKGGLLVLFGAEAGRDATPGMIGYGMSKAATHHLVSSLAADINFPGKVACLLPITLDTPSNRKYMGDQDTSTWTPMPLIAKEIEKWLKDGVVHGGLYTIKTLSGNTSFILNK